MLISVLLTEKSLFFNVDKVLNDISHVNLFFEIVLKIFN